jgi:hypothetical protein
MKIQSITTRLSEGGYARTRRELADRLLDVVAIINGGNRSMGLRGLSASPPELGDISAQIRLIQGCTEAVMHTVH